MNIKVEDILGHSYGAKFKDVVEDKRISFENVLNFFSDEERQKRMENSQIHHDRPALAGVIKEFEQTPEFDSFFKGYDAHETVRFRQSIGVVVQILMEKKGWSKTGKKVSLGVRKKVTPGTTTPGAYYNKSGLSLWFTKAEYYVKKD